LVVPFSITLGKVIRVETTLSWMGRQGSKDKFAVKTSGLYTSTNIMFVHGNVLNLEPMFKVMCHLQFIEARQKRTHLNKTHYKVLKVIPYRNCPSTLAVLRRQAWTV